jgi:hypothetical protein
LRLFPAQEHVWKQKYPCYRKSCYNRAVTI